MTSILVTLFSAIVMQTYVDETMDIKNINYQQNGVLLWSDCPAGDLINKMGESILSHKSFSRNLSTFVML